MASLMRALIIDDTKSASVRHVPVPVPGPRQVVVDVHRAGVCGTDVELFTRELAYFDQGKSSFPLCPGHEWCGTVSATGAGVDERLAGARVTGDTMLGCGRCRRCASGRHHVCAERNEIGIMGGRALSPRSFSFPLAVFSGFPTRWTTAPGRSWNRAATRCGPCGPRRRDRAAGC